MWKIRLGALLILVFGAGIGYFIYASEPSLHKDKVVPYQTQAEKLPFKLGLDLSGGATVLQLSESHRVTDFFGRLFARCDRDIHNGPV